MIDKLANVVLVSMWQQDMMGWEMDVKNIDKQRFALIHGHDGERGDR